MGKSVNLDLCDIILDKILKPNQLVSYIIKFGFLDGKYGFEIARYSAYGTYLKYKELKKIQNN